MSELRVGLVGAGMVAPHHVAAWERCAGAQLVAIADPDRRAAERLGGPGVTLHHSLADLLRDTRVDAVDIASPVATHTDLVREACAAGLPVLCQKPLAPTVEEAERLVSTLGPDARVMLHENWRWRPSYRALKAYLSVGAKPDHFDFRCESSGLCRSGTGGYPALERQPFLAELDRLIVFELLGHHLDVLSYLFGPVKILAAERRRTSAAVIGEDFARIDLVAGGVAGSLTGDFRVPDAPPRPRDRLALDGRCVLDDWRLDVEGQVTDWSHDTGYQASYDACIAHFAACNARAEPFETPVVQGVTLLRWVEEVYALAARTEAPTDTTSGGGW